MRILVVEDNNDINKLLVEMLEGNGYEVRGAYSGTEALLYLKVETFDMVLLDLMLPGKSGEEVMKEIRKVYMMPILIISAKQEKETRIEMLRLGGDDFISKPFDIDEVLARVASHLRRYTHFSKEKRDSLVTYKELTLDEETREVKVRDKKLILTTREFDILHLLLSHPKKVFSKPNIFESVWDEEFLGDDNTINVHISNLRTKIAKAGSAEEYIQTIWGIGYKLD